MEITLTATLNDSFTEPGTTNQPDLVQSPISPSEASPSSPSHPKGIGRLDSKFAENEFDADNPVVKPQVVPFEIEESIEKIQKKQQGKSTKFQAGVNFLKATLGIGVLSLPYAFYQTGYILASIMQVFINGCVFYTTFKFLKMLNMIIKRKQLQQISFAEIFYLTIGKWGSLAFDIFVIMFQLGSAIGYVTFFARFGEIIFNMTDTNIHRLYYLLASLVVIIPMSMTNNYHFFYKWTIWAIAFAAIALLGVMIYSIYKMATLGEIDDNLIDVADLKQLPSFIGISIFAFESFASIIPVRNSMRDPSDFKTVFICIAVIATSIYLTVSIVCLLGLGQHMDPIVLMAIEKDFSWLIALQALYAVSLLITYPLQIYPVNLAINRIPFVKRFVESEGCGKPIRKYIPRLVILLIIYLIAFAAPQFSTLINLTGALAGTSIQFLLPLIAFEVYFWKGEKRIFERITNCMIILLGIVGGIFAIRHSMIEIINYYK